MSDKTISTVGIGNIVKQTIMQDLPSNIVEAILNQPISGIKWVHRDQLNPNLYNPNKMAPPEMDLLVQSIKADGWLFPILTLPIDVHVDGFTDNADLDKFTIIDGFHRYQISGHDEVYPLTEGYVPIVHPMGSDIMATTVRMNRVKGTHGVLGMASIVKILLEQGKNLEYIMREYGMEKEEVVRLAASQGIPQTDIIKNGKYSEAWEPGKTKE